jgi:hypothetical protein
VDHATTTVGFELNQSQGIGIDAPAVQSLLSAQAQASFLTVFEGPYQTTGQHPALVKDQTLSDSEWGSMCWFADGMKEKSDPTNPLSADRPAKVPATDYQPVDVSDTFPKAPPWILLSVPDAPRGVGWNCDENQIKN